MSAQTSASTAMSAAAARRRKQQEQRRREKEASSDNADVSPTLNRLNSLLSSPSPSEDEAYEALQLAQSQVRRYMKQSETYSVGVEFAYNTSVKFLEKLKVSVASQLLALLADVIYESKTACTSKHIDWIVNIDKLYKHALNEISSQAKDSPDETKVESEVDRLQRLHTTFLKKMLRWCAEYGTVLYGDLSVHALLAEQLWTASQSCKSDADEDEDEAHPSSKTLRAEAMTHFALAERPDRMIELLFTLPEPTPAQEKTGRDGGIAAERDCLLTRSVLVMTAVENLRDANILLRSFIEADKKRDIKVLAKSYMDKTDGKAPSHPMFCCMLLRVCEKDRAGPLFQWLLRSFNNDLSSMKPEVKSYTTKIGRVYFGIQPPPNMMNMMENMMAMMSGGGVNPAMMAGMR